MNYYESFKSAIVMPLAKDHTHHQVVGMLLHLLIKGVVIWAIMDFSAPGITYYLY